MQIIVPLKKIDLFVEKIEYLFKKYEPSITLYSLKNFKGEKKYLSFSETEFVLLISFKIVKISNLLMN